MHRPEEVAQLVQQDLQSLAIRYFARRIADIRDTKGHAQGPSPALIYNPNSFGNPMTEDFEEFDPVELPIDGTLDLHTFKPREVKDLVVEYLAACRERGILDVRIIHGKGTGTLRRTVHAILKKLPDVSSFRLAGGDGGGWGATLVTLEPLEKS